MDDYSLEDYRIELVNVRGTSFYPFMYLFNSTDIKKRVSKPISVLTDQDQFPSSKNKEYSFNRLLDTNYKKLLELDDNIQKGQVATRVENLCSVALCSPSIYINSAFKTLEYELALANIPKDWTKLPENLLFRYLETMVPSKTDKIKEYVSTFENTELSVAERRRTAILIWKIMPNKADFAQDFSLYILENLDQARQFLVVPQYIKTALNQLK